MKILTIAQVHGCRPYGDRHNPAHSHDPFATKPAFLACDQVIRRLFAGPRRPVAGLRWLGMQRRHREVNLSGTQFFCYPLGEMGKLLYVDAVFILEDDLTCKTAASYVMPPHMSKFYRNEPNPSRSQAIDCRNTNLRTILMSNPECRLYVVHANGDVDLHRSERLQSRYDIKLRLPADSERQRHG